MSQLNSKPRLHPVAYPAPSAAPVGLPSDLQGVLGDAATQRRGRAEQARAASAWSTKDKIKRILWAATEKTLFRATFHNWYGVRNKILRAFGADVAPTARIRRTVRVEIPWNLTIRDHAQVGDDVRLYALGKITIGQSATVSQHSHLCAGTHDFTRPDFPLLTPPITVGDHAWIAADAFVGPGVHVGTGAILGARGAAFKDLEAWTIYGGNAAKPLGKREFKTA